MANRMPGASWFLRRIGRYPNGYVRTCDTPTTPDGIQVVWYESEGWVPHVLELPRRDARLLAKRINQCLDRTAKK